MTTPLLANADAVRMPLAAPDLTPLPKSVRMLVVAVEE